MSPPIKVTDRQILAAHLCDISRQGYCKQFVKIMEITSMPYDQWPEALGRCIVCSHFTPVDFAGTY